MAAAVEVVAVSAVVVVVEAEELVVEGEARLVVVSDVPPVQAATISATTISLETGTIPRCIGFSNLEHDARVPRQGQWVSEVCGTPWVCPPCPPATAQLVLPWLSPRAIDFESIEKRTDMADTADGACVLGLGAAVGWSCSECQG